MAEARSLIKDSTIYGGSTILVRMVNWLLTTLFTYTLAESEFGMMTNLYAYVAVIIVILTFGMETGFFRFVSQTEKYKSHTVYATSLINVTAIVCLFLVIFLGFFNHVRNLIWSPEIPGLYIKLIIIILSLDTISAIPFAYLRYKKRPIRFGFLKILNVVLYTLFCVFFLIVCPWINKHNPHLISWFWRDNFNLGYVFISNLLATGIQTAFLFSDVTGFKYIFDGKLAKKMFGYCFPLMLMGLAGMSNQVVDKLVFPAVYPDTDNTFSELGVYGACFKIALIMMMFTQAFRYAYEPFVFEKSKDKNATQSYAVVMKYFVILGLLVFLVTMFYLDIIKYFISPRYFAALPVVPIVLMGELFFAVYFNLSIWYKLTDKTYWGTIFSVMGFVLIIILNIVFIPKYSYMACAWASFAGNGLIMILSYIVGQKYYPVKYDLKSLFLYLGVAMLLYCIAIFVPIENIGLRLAFRTFLIGIYLLLLVKRDLPLEAIPFIRSNKK
jgi:O-antigen/teichoic acid export membrane protein